MGLQLWKRYCFLFEVLIESYFYLMEEWRNYGVLNVGFNCGVLGSLVKLIDCY